MIMRSTQACKARGARRNRQSGLSLFEVLMSVALLTIFLTLFGKVFVNSMQLSALNAQTLDRMLAASEIREEFTALVRASEGVAPGVGIHETGRDRIVLRMPATDGAACFVVLGSISREDRLSRMDVVANGEQYEVAHFQNYALPVAEIAFAVTPAAAGGAACVSLDFQARPDAGERMPQPMRHRCIAAPRGVSQGRDGQ